MYVVTVVPILRGTPLDELTYYTVRVVRIGDIVHASLRGTEQPMIVVGVEDVATVKTALRSQHFELQKLGGHAPHPLIDPACIEACVRTATHHACTVGALIHSLVPKSIIETHPERTHEPIPHTGSFQQLALQETYAERVLTYKNIARESIARQESLLILCPRRISAERMHESISKGIEHYVELMHGGLSRKAVHAIWESHAHAPSPKIIIGTYQSLSLPLHKLGAIIIERESDDAYQLIERPHLDARILATELARAHTARIIAADTMLRVKTYTECEQGYREHYTPPLHKVRSESAIVCIQKKTEERSHVFSHELVEHITDLVSRKKKILILVARKGIASSVWCTDCGTMLRCAQCKSTQRLVKGGDTGDVPTLACMRCGETESSHTTCTNCGSWKLKNYGFTIEMVKKYVETHWSKTTVTSIDTDSHTEYETKKALGHVHETTDAEIVVATAHTLAYGIHFDVTIVISMESFMAAPVYSADESAFRMFLYAKEQTKESLLFQTMLPKDDRMRACIEHGEIATFLKSERALRTTLKLPPEVVHISLSVRGRRAEVIESVRSMLETLKTFRPRPFKELVRVSPTLVEHTTIVRSPTASWPDAQVVAALKTVDPVFNIKVQTD